MSDNAIVWFRRDLRVGDQPMFLAAAEAGGETLGLFVLDDALLKPSGPVRRAYLYRSLRALDEQLGGRLLVVRGDPVDVLPRLAAAVGATTVHVAADFGPYGARRDQAVAEALGDVELVRTGSPYAVAPGRVTKTNGEAYRVFTPFRRAWHKHGWRDPAQTDAATVRWLDPAQTATIKDGVEIPDDEKTGAELPEAGEAAAHECWKEFLDGPVDGYHDGRDRPDRPATSRMSVYLKWGQIHPRTMLADLSQMQSQSRDTYRSELAWREFYADVLFQHPDSARTNYDKKFDKLVVDGGAAGRLAFEMWREGRTGFPIVDAGMRQLLTEGWMHNRVRMIVASFLVKDLHLPWWWGARYFMRQLVDGDLASNQHGWQWTAGCGTDAAPYYRIFNPITQGERFDPDGDYVRRYVPELRDVPGKKAHQPWALPGGAPNGYPAPMVDHANERKDALARYEVVKG